jgi:hypothetical protein
MTYFGQAGVYLLKTKVVIFRNRGNIKSEEKWYLNGESIEICNECNKQNEYVEIGNKNPRRPYGDLIF